MTMPRPLSPVDESHQILLSTLEALRATDPPDGNVHVRYNGGQPLSGQAGGSHLTAGGRLEVEIVNPEPLPDEPKLESLRD
jgi:hypothetical protein